MFEIVTHRTNTLPRFRLFDTCYIISNKPRVNAIKQQFIELKYDHKCLTVTNASLD